MSTSKLSRGFTIVELLIVIVVIGILASITIVAFNGIQERARLASGQAFASQLIKKHVLNTSAYWTFDECSGSSVKSQGDNSVTSTVVGTLTWSTDTPTGQGCSVQFNGATRIQTTASLASDYYLKAAWIKFTVCANNNVLSSPDVGGTDAPVYIPGCRISAGHAGSYSRITSPNLLQTNKWYHIAIEFDNGTYRLFEDGKMVRETSGHPAVSPIEPGVNIGAHRTGSNFNGWIDSPLVVAGKSD